jgi:hypothetical protein
MPLTRLLVAALLAAPLSVFAQNEAKSSQPAPPDLSAPLPNTQPTVSEPWRMVPNDAAETASLADSFSMHSSDSVLDSSSDNTCYAIHSFVVARDHKNSDSTHFVRSSTCQPASRYRLRTTEIEVQTTER